VVENENKIHVPTRWNTHAKHAATCTAKQTATHDPNQRRDVVENNF
jgi:hypothetical protein